VFYDYYYRDKKLSVAFVRFSCASILGHIVLMSIIGLMFIFKAGWEVHLFGLCFLFRDIGCIFTKAYFHIAISALFWCRSREGT
jgi:hypothetical protein